jgi:hypothetical protein
MTGLLAVTGCAAGAVVSAPSTMPSAVTSGEASSPNPIPAAAATPTPTAAGFTIPERCEDVLSPAIAATMLARGFEGKELSPSAGVPVGAPMEIPNYDPKVKGYVAATVTDYILCGWGKPKKHYSTYVTIAAVDPASRVAFAKEIKFFYEKTDITKDVVVMSFNGNIFDSAGNVSGNFGLAEYGVLTDQSYIHVQVMPGGQAALKRAKGIVEDVATIVHADWR